MLFADVAAAACGDFLALATIRHDKKTSGAVQCIHLPVEMERQTAQKR
jgi:hypothetical protein